MWWLLWFSVVYKNDDIGLTFTYFKQGKILSKLLVVLQTNSQVSVYRTVGALVVSSNCISLVWSLRSMLIFF